MNNNAKNRHGLISKAANCKKILKNLKIRTAAISAGAIAVSAAAIILAGSLSSNEPKLSASISKAPVSSAASMNLIPPKAFDVRINVDGKTVEVKCSGTVSDALDTADIKVYDDDLINIGLNEPLNGGTNIVINRVDIIEEVEVKTIEYATKYREDDEQTVGYTETVVDGEEGEIETTLRHVYVDGELVSSAVIDEEVTEPVDEVVVVGTKEEEPEPEPVIDIPDEPVPAAQTAYSSDITLDENGVPVEYTQILTGSSCAYTAPAGALTSTGRTAAVGLVAVNPDIIPYGTELYITSSDGSRVYGYAIAADTGGAVMRGSIIVDLFMNSESDCYDWGRRDVNIYVLS